MGEVGGDGNKGRGKTQSGGNILQVCDTGGDTVWLGELGPIDGNVESGGRDSHRISEKNRGKSGAA